MISVKISAIIHCLSDNRQHSTPLTACLFPLLRPKSLSISNSQWNCSTLCIQVVEGVGDVRVSIRGRVHEPLRWVDLLGQDEGKEDKQRADIQARVEASRRDVVVLSPPALEATLDEAVEEDADRTPAQVDVHRCWRDPTSTTEDERPVQIPDVAARESLGGEIGDDRKCSAEQPVPLQSRVNATGAEDASRADNTPDHGCSVEYTSTRAGVPVGLIRFTDARNRSECPVEDGDLDDTGPNTSNDLRSEGNTGLSGDDYVSKAGVAGLIWHVNFLPGP